MVRSRRFLILCCAAAVALPSAALAQKSQSQLDWEAQQTAFLADTAKKPGWKVSASGLAFKRVAKPNPKGKMPTADSEVEVRYVGKTVTDNQFDASPEGETSSFGLSGVIKGWEEGIPMMREGEVWDFVVPANLAYGDRPKPGIPAGSALQFEVTLVKVLTNAAAAPPPAAAKPPAKKK